MLLKIEMFSCEEANEASGRYSKKEVTLFIMNSFRNSAKPKLSPLMGIFSCTLNTIAA